MRGKRTRKSVALIYKRIYMSKHDIFSSFSFDTVSHWRRLVSHFGKWGTNLLNSTSHFVLTIRLTFIKSIKSPYRTIYKTELISHCHGCAMHLISTGCRGEVGRYLTYTYYTFSRQLMDILRFFLTRQDWNQFPDPGGMQSLAGLAGPDP